MAKKNAREEPPSPGPQVSENVQMSDIVFILDKMELLLKAVSEIGKDGKFKTVPADKEHSNSFLKIDRYADIFENFIKNFWSQFKDPTRFGILSVREGSLDDPEVWQAVEDLAAGKKRKPWKSSSRSMKSSHGTRKTKVSTHKIKKKWQRKPRHSSRLPQKAASSRTPTVTTSP